MKARYIIAILIAFAAIVWAPSITHYGAIQLCYVEINDYGPRARWWRNECSLWFPKEMANWQLREDERVRNWREELQ
jgi:hypothetical protein